MNVRKNARQTPSGRVPMIERIESGWSVGRAAAASGSRRGEPIAGSAAGGLAIMSFSIAVRPHRCPRRLNGTLAERIVQLRRERRSSPVIATGVGPSPVDCSAGAQAARLTGVIEHALIYFHGLMMGKKPLPEFAALTDGSAAMAAIATADAPTLSLAEDRKVWV